MSVILGLFAESNSQVRKSPHRLTATPLRFTLTLCYPDGFTWGRNDSCRSIADANIIRIA